MRRLTSLLTVLCLLLLPACPADCQPCEDPSQLFC